MEDASKMRSNYIEFSLRIGMFCTDDYGEKPLPSIVIIVFATDVRTLEEMLHAFGSEEAAAGRCLGKRWRMPA